MTDTKTRLLDAAEHLFSNKGFANTSLRAITTMAEANLAAANYHFGNKEALLNAVLERRFLPLNQQRLERIERVLSEAQARKRKPEARDLVTAFVEPTLRFKNSDDGAREFVRLVGRSLTAADAVVRDQVLQLVQPVFLHMHQALCLALPHLSPELIFTRLFFSMGALGHCLCFQGMSKIFSTCPECAPEDDDMMTENLITFITAGLEAP